MLDTVPSFPIRRFGLPDDPGLDLAKFTTAASPEKRLSKHIVRGRSISPMFRRSSYVTKATHCLKAFEGMSPPKMHGNGAKSDSTYLRSVYGV